MYLLAFETSFGKFSISLFRDGQEIAAYTGEKENEQAEMLIPAIEDMLAKNAITYNELDYIAVGTGPGSFTGVRIGLAAAKGMALACRAELLGITSLEASAFKHGGGEIFLNANRGEAYRQSFDAGLNALNEAELVKHEGAFSNLPNASAIGHVALLKLSGKINSPTTPLYVRKPDAKLRPKKSAAQ